MDVNLHLGLADLVLDALDEGADLLDLLMGEQDGAQHLLLGELLGSGIFLPTSKTRAWLR